MAKIIITIDGDNVTVNQSVIPTKVEQENKKFFIIMRDCNFDERSWVEFVSDNYISATNKLKDFQKRTSEIYPIEEGWHLEYSEWNTITI